MSDGEQAGRYARVTISMPSNTLERLRAAVEAGAASSLSALVSDAVAARLERDEALRALAALRGPEPLPDHALAWARQVLGVDTVTPGGAGQIAS